MAELGKHLRIWMKRNHVTRAKVVALTGLDTGTLSNMLNGRSNKEENYQKICDAFNISFDDLTECTDTAITPEEFSDACKIITDFVHSFNKNDSVELDRLIMALKVVANMVHDKESRTTIEYYLRGTKDQIMLSN